MYNNYYAPYQRPIGYYNPAIPVGQENANYMQNPQYPQSPQITQTAPVATPTTTSDMLWVLNETEATSYPVAPNNSVTLWDKNNDTVYIKSVNMQGVPSMRILDYKERTCESATKTACIAKSTDINDFIKRDDFNALQSKIEGLQSELNDLKARTKVKTLKREVSDDE